MRRTIVVYGLVAGVLMGCFMLAIASLCLQDIISIDKTEVVGYASMVVALSMVFFGIKSYRDKQGNGVIGFWKGVRIGLLISLVASVLYGIAGEVYYQIAPGSSTALMEKYADHQLETMKAGGASLEEIARTEEQISTMKKMMESPLVRFGMALIEILPVGIIVTFASAGILRRREVLPA